MLVDDLTLIDCIGKGAFSNVYLTSKNGNSKQYATKVIEKPASYMEENVKKYIDREISILKEVDHPNIIKFIESKETEKKIYIVTEYCNGGELESYLLRHQLQNKNGLSEEIVQHIMKQIVNALEYLSAKEIMYRNIVLRDILINYEDENDKRNNNILKGTIKIIDFGFAIHLKKGELAYTTLGSPINMSPLLLNKLSFNENYKNIGYDEKEDVWSLGAICYELLTGKPAFDSNNFEELTVKVDKGDYYVPTTLSKEAISFLKCMLQYESKNRLSFSELKNQDFLTKKVEEFSKVDLNEFKNITKENEPQIILNSKSNE